MNIEKRSARFGAAILLLSLLLRILVGLVSTGAQAEKFTPHRPVGGISIQSGTVGSAGPSVPVATFPITPATTIPTMPTTTIPTMPTTTAPALPSLPPEPPGFMFSPADMQYVSMLYSTAITQRPALEPLLLQKLDWQLDSGEPTVLIVHTHATESYTRQPGENYVQSGDYRTENEAFNMLAVGDALAALLRSHGVVVLHDRQQHDAVSYNAAYSNARKSVEAYLAQYPSIRMVLDLHRDAALNADGSQYATSATVNGEETAQLMLVAGCDPAGGQHPGWRDNLALALKLQVLLERENPGITRRTLLRGYVYNQDLCSGMLIVEVGTAGNSLEEALRTMPPLADAIAALTNGANR